MPKVLVLYDVSAWANKRTAPFETGIIHLMANVYMHHCGKLSAYICTRDLHSGRAALTSHQTNPYFVRFVGDSGSCHSPGACRIRQARLCENANRSFKIVIFHVVVNVYMENCGQQLTFVSVTCFPEGLPLPVSKPTQVVGESANGSFETVIFHMMVNVYMESWCNPTANTCIRDQFPGRVALTSH